MNWWAVGAFVVAVAGPLVTYLVAIRGLSGKITHSAAEQLWEESRSIRDFLEQRNTFLTDKIDRLEKEIEDLRRENRELHKENGTLIAVIKSHEATIKDQRRRIGALESERDLLKGRVSELEARDESRG